MAIIKTTLYFCNGFLYLLIIAMWMVIGDEQWLNWALTVFNLALTVGLILLDRQRFFALYSSERFRFLGNTFIRTILLLAILSLINYWAYKYVKIWDLGQWQEHTLSMEAKKVLSSITDEMRLMVFSKGSQLPAYRQLMEIYRASNHLLLIEYYDMEVRPDLVQTYDITRPGTVVVIKGRAIQKFIAGDELSVINGLLKANRPRQPKIHWIDGHGELSLHNDQDDGGKFFHSYIGKSGLDLEVTTIDYLVSSKTTPELIMLWGPKSGLLPYEYRWLREYLLKGGKVLLAIDPNLSQELFSEMRKLLTEFHIELPNKLVVDPEQNVSGSLGVVPIVYRIGQDHPITQGIAGPVFFPLTSGVLSYGQGGNFFPLITASEGSFLSRPVGELVAGEMPIRKKDDISGPIPLMVLSGPIVVVGTSGLVHNKYQKFPNNFRLIISAIRYFLDPDAIASITPPISKSDQSPIFISGQQVTFAFFVSVLLIPIVLLMVGGWIFYQRRKL